MVGHSAGRPILGVDMTEETSCAIRSLWRQSAVQIGSVFLGPAPIFLPHHLPIRFMSCPITPARPRGSGRCNGWPNVRTCQPSDSSGLRQNNIRPLGSLRMGSCTYNYLICLKGNRGRRNYGVGISSHGREKNDMIQCPERRKRNRKYRIAAPTRQILLTTNAGSEGNSSR